MKIDITPEFLKPYFSGEKKHEAYKATVQIMNRLKSHANGEHPSYQFDNDDDDLSDIITAKRPNEAPESKKYRTDIYVPITKSAVSKVLSSLMKIRKSRDWNIKYNEQKVSKKLTEDEEMEEYCEHNYPYFTSITQWMFNVGLKHYCIDSNGVVMVMPLETNIVDGEFYKPFAFCFDSSQVYDYLEGEYAILLSTDKSTYTSGSKTYNDGKVFYVVTRTNYQRWEQINKKEDMELKSDFKHDIGILPVFKNKGVFYKAMDKIFLWESRLDPIVPRLTEAAREYSDLQIEVTLHTHSEKWVWAMQECKVCGGTGKVNSAKGSVLCSAKGCVNGRTFGSPFQQMTVSPPMLGETPAPIPPAGYIVKSVDIVKIQNERIREHLYEALSSINMQFIAEVPHAQSGVAKEVDRDELNNFVNAIAEDVVWIMDRIYFFVNEIRNKVRIPDKKERADQLPTIAVPDKFDLISIETSLDMIVKSRNNNLSPQLINALELEYAQKQFSSDPEIKERLSLYFLLDPLSGIPEDAKTQRLVNNGITKEDYIISCNIEQFIEQAIFDDENFCDLSLIDQKAVIKKLAEVKVKELSAKEAAMKQIAARIQPMPGKFLPKVA